MEYPFEMNVQRSVTINLVNGLNNNGNCEVGLFEVKGALLRSQVVTGAYKIYIQQEWERANDLTRSIKLLKFLMAPQRIGQCWTQGRAPMCGITPRMPALTPWSACTGAASR
jgi:hypothetical protein